MVNYTELELKVINKFQEMYDKVWTKKFTKQITDMLTKSLSDYKRKNNLNTFILPLSGGLDSAIVAGLCKNININTVFIDIDSNPQALMNAGIISNLFKTKHSRRIITEDVSEILTSMIIDINKKYFDINAVRVGNVKARIRMMIAYDMARYLNGCVLSTDNYSEYNMGFWTVNGDVGDIAPIQFMNKGFELQYIAKHLGIPDDIINQAPSDDLNVTTENTDESQLGASYKFIDVCMCVHLNEFGSLNKNKVDDKEYTEFEELIEEFKENSDLYTKIVSKYTKTKYKRNNGYNANLFQVAEA